MIIMIFIVKITVHYYILIVTVFLCCNHKDLLTFHFILDTPCLCPSKPANGTILYECSGNQSFGSYVSFSCDPGFYQSSGDTTRRCSPGGNWSGTTLLCEKGQYCCNQV